MLECDTPYREGYFMNAEEQKTAKATAWLDYAEAKERRALLENEAEKLAKNFESVAKLLRERPETITFDGDAATMKNYNRFGALVEDMKAIRTELQRLDKLVRDLGLSHLLNKQAH
jgi:hypothetical protein